MQGGISPGQHLGRGRAPPSPIPKISSRLLFRSSTFLAAVANVTVLVCRNQTTEWLSTPQLQSPLRRGQRTQCSRIRGFPPLSFSLHPAVNVDSDSAIDCDLASARQPWRSDGSLTFSRRPSTPPRVLHLPNHSKMCRRPFCVLAWLAERGRRDGQGLCACGGGVSPAERCDAISI